MAARMAQIKAMTGKGEGKILEAIPFRSTQIQLEVPYSSTVFPPLPTKNLAGTSTEGTTLETTTNILMPPTYIPSICTP